MKKDTLEDMMQTSLCIVKRGTHDKGDFEELLLGTKRVSVFFSERYHLEKAISHASKTAHLSALILYDAKGVEKFKDSLVLKAWLIAEPMNTMP